MGFPPSQLRLPKLPSTIRMADLAFLSSQSRSSFLMSNSSYQRNGHGYCMICDLALYADSYFRRLSLNHNTAFINPGAKVFSSWPPPGIISSLWSTPAFANARSIAWACCSGTTLSSSP